MHNLLTDSIQAVHAVEAGADAIAVMLPSYFKPPSLGNTNMINKINTISFSLLLAFFRGTGIVS